MTAYTPILMYHNISNDKNDHSSIYYKDFYKQIKYLTMFGYQCLSLKNINHNNVRKKIVITFDDGYENVFRYAIPILDQFKQKATCFIVKNQIDGFNKWDIDRNDYKETKLMNLKQIQELHLKGYEIGSHTEDHLNLTKLSYDEKKNQIIRPIDFFKKKLNIDIESFAYPFGSYDDDCIQIIKNNYKYAVTTKPSRYNMDKFKNYEIPRISINSKTSLFKFFLKTLTKYEDYKYRTIR